MNQYMKGVLCTIIGGACWGISGPAANICVPIVGWTPEF